MAMNVRSYAPHSASTVTDIKVFKVTLPSAISSELDLGTPLATYNFATVLENYTDVLTYSDDKSIFYYTWIADDDYNGYENGTWTALDYLVNESWNTLALYGDTVLLSIIYWDEAIPATNRRFLQIMLEYSSVSTIISNVDTMNLLRSYATHVTNLASLNSKNEFTDDEIHPETLNYFATDSQRTTLFERNSASGYQQVSDWTTTRLLGPSQSDEEFYDLPLTGHMDFKAIPAEIIENENAILFTSPWTGAGFYDPDTGMVYAARNFQGPLPPSGWESMGEMRVYNFSLQIFLFYFPETYTVYISCQNSEVVCDNGEMWQTPWKVGATGTHSSNVKYVVPSYFSIVPILFMHINGVYQLVHIMNLTEDTDYNDTSIGTAQVSDDSENAVNSTSADSMYDLWSRTNPSVDTRARHVQTVNVFFNRDTSLFQLNSYSSSAGQTMYCLLWDEMLGYGAEYKVDIVNYWVKQYFISYHTMMQCLHYYPHYRVDILDCGVKCSREGFRDIWIPYSAIDYEETQCPTITLPEGSMIDNMLFYSDGVIRSLNGDDYYEIPSRYTKLQMKNGIIAGYTSSYWEVMNNG